MQIKIINQNKFKDNDIVESRIKYFDKKNKLVFENNFYLYCKVRENDFTPKIKEKLLNKIVKCEVRLIKKIGSPAQIK